MANKEFSEKIQKARINAGLSQRDVAEFLGYSTPQFISNWERGVSTPPMNAVALLEEKYGISIYPDLVSFSVGELKKDLDRKYQSAMKKVKVRVKK